MSTRGANLAIRSFGVVLFPILLAGQSLAAVFSEALIAKLECPDRVESVAFSPDGQLLAAGYGWRREGGVRVWKTSDHTVFLCDIQAQHCRTLSLGAGPAQEYIAAGFSANGKALAVCRNAAVQWWDVATGQTVHSWDERGLGFFCSLSSSRKYILAGGGAVYGDKNVDLLDATKGESLARVSAIRSGLFTSAISHSDQWIALGGGDYGSGGDLSLWSLRDFHEVGYISAGNFPIQGLAFSSDDSILAVGSEDGVVFLLCVEKLRGPERTRQKYAPCGEVLSEENKVYIVPLAKVPGFMSPRFEYAWKVEVVEPGRLAAFAGYPVALQDWEIQSDATTHKARVNKFVSLWWGPKSDRLRTDYALTVEVPNGGLPVRAATG